MPNPEGNNPTGNTVVGDAGATNSTPNATPNATPGTPNPAPNPDPNPAPLTAPEKYEFKFDDGHEVDTKLVDRMTPSLKKLNLTQEQATELAKEYKNHVSEKMAEMFETHNNKIKAWGEESEKDPDIGGTPEKFTQSLAEIDKALVTYGSEELRKLLDESGLGNNKEVLKFFAKVGRTLKEDSPPDGGNNPNGTQKAPASTRMYPTMQK